MVVERDIASRLCLGYPRRFEVMDRVVEEIRKKVG
jgi:hypothetical protein